MIRKYLFAAAAIIPAIAFADSQGLDAEKQNLGQKTASYYRFFADKPDGGKLLAGEVCYVGPPSPANYKLKDYAATYPASQCEADVAELFNYYKGQQQAAAAAAQDRARQQQIAADQRAAQEKLKADALNADLRAGRVKPANLEQAAVVYGAEFGGDLASAPKIRPDGGMYYLHGKIQMAGEEPEFLASLSASQDNNALATVLRRSRGMGESTDYFAVKIPKQLRDYYFNNAKIGRGFDIVGKYTSNTKYSTVSGEEKQAPVFEAAYFVLW